MSHADVLRELPYLTEEDIRACLAYAADRERKADISNVLSPRESTNELSSRPSDWIGFANPITRGGTCCFRPGAITDIRRLSKTNSRFLDFAGPFARE